MKSAIGLAACLVTGLIVSTSRGADGPAAGVEPRLTPDSALLGRIAALPDNTWMKLPACKTTGDLAWLKGDPDYLRDGPRVRDYCNKMVWAPERGRALYCGAGHNVHPRNDVWEYDLAANTWVCLYGADPLPGRPTTQASDAAVEWARRTVVLRDGVIRTVRGGPVRPAHTWWGLAYDPDKRRLVFWDAHKGLMFTNRSAIAAALKLDPKAEILSSSGSGPGEAWVFSFNPQTREWKEVMTKAPKAYESSELEYLADRKTLWLHSGQTYILDDKGQWIVTAPATAGPGSAGLTACDPESRTIVSIRGDQTYVYSTADDRWKLAVKHGPVGGRVPLSTFCFDSHARKFVLYTCFEQKPSGAPEHKLWLYDPGQNKWTDPAPAGDAPKMCNVAGYYDPQRNVTVVYANAETWVYRSAKGAAEPGE